MEPNFTYILLLCLLLQHQVNVINGISGGSDILIRRYPSQLSLHHNGSLICGAGLVDAKWAITTAKCVNGKDTGLSIRAGSSRPDKGGSLFDVKKAYVCPDYDEDTLEGNLALLEFNEDIEDDYEHITPTALQNTNKELEEGTRFDIAGWGQTDSNGTYPKLLQFTYLQAISREACRNIYSYEEISNDMMCGTLGRVTSCEGDFGGPCIAVRTYGVMSWGKQCGDDKYPVVCTLIYPYHRWISSVTGINITNAP